MSLGDYVRYLRAVKGGPTPWEIEAASGIPAGIYRQIEQRYRAIGEEQLLEKMATYYEVAPDELRWRQNWPRKGLTSACLLYTSDAADERSSVDLGGRRIIKKKKRVKYWLCVGHLKINEQKNIMAKECTQRQVRV